MKLYNINSSGINFQTLAHSLSHFHGEEKTRCTTTHRVRDGTIEGVGDYTNLVTNKQMLWLTV